MSQRYELARHILAGRTRREIQALGLPMKHYSAVANGLAHGSLHVASHARMVAGSPARAEILDLLAQGLTVEQIAADPRFSAHDIRASWRIWGLRDTAARKEESAASGASTHASTPDGDNDAGRLQDVLAKFLARYPTFLSTMGRLLAGDTLTPQEWDRIGPVIRHEFSGVTSAWEGFSRWAPAVDIQELEFHLQYQASHPQPWRIHHAQTFLLGARRPPAPETPESPS